MKLEITNVSCDWKNVKNKARVTDNKMPTEKGASEDFIKKILISEHSPIRLARIEWLWEGIKSWVATHYVRHHNGIEKWVSTQRTDRTGVNRDELSQSAPVNMAAEANAQALINMARYRLCMGQAAHETYQCMADLKAAIYEAGEKELSDVMVPNCVYRCGCPEFKSCGLLDRMLDEAAFGDSDLVPDDFNLTNIQHRYDLYNNLFWRGYSREAGNELESDAEA